MKCQSLFTGKLKNNNKKNIRLLSTEFAQIGNNGNG